MRKLLDYFILCFVTIGLVFAPSVAYANPLVLIPWLMTEAGAVSVSNIAVGAVGVGIAVNIAKPSNGDPSEICLHPSCMATPSGWTKPSSSSGPVPPGSSSPQGPVYYGIGGSSPNEATACAKIVSYYQSINRPLSGGCIVVGRGLIKYAGVVAYLSVSGNDFCASGYKFNSSGACVYDSSGVSGSVSKPAGTPCQILQVGSSFQLDPDNPGCVNSSNPGTLLAKDGSTINVGAGGLNVVPPNYVPGKTGQPHMDVIPSGPGRITMFNYTPQALGSPTNINPSVPLGQPLDLTQVATIEPVNGQPTVTSVSVSVGDTTPSSTGSIPAMPSITCASIGTCGVAQEATLKQIASSTAAMAAASGQNASGGLGEMGPAVPAMTAADYGVAIANLQAQLPKPADYQGPVSSILAKVGFPQPSNQCSLTRTITLWGATKTIDFIPQGICGPYQKIINWMTWGGVAFLAWRQVKSLAGDKEDLPGST